MSPQVNASVDRLKTTPRRTSAAVWIPLAVAVASLLVGGAVGFFLRHSPADELAAQIDARVRELGVKPSSVELVDQKAQRARRAIKAGDFATAAQITRGVLGASEIQNWRYFPFGDFIAAVFKIAPSELGGGLDAWVAKDGADALPLLFRAQYYYEVGWAERGHEFSAATAAERLTAFAADMEKALADVNAAIRLDGGNPYDHDLKLRILQAQEDPQRFAAAFDEAVAKYPNDYRLYAIALNALQPRWGGSIPAMYAFVEKYAGGAPQFSPLKLLYLSLYQRLLSTASVECGAKGGDRDKTAQCVAASVQETILPALEQNTRAALQLYDHADTYEFGVAVKAIVADLLATKGGDAYSGAVLQLLVSSMHSDAQLSETNPGHNDYMADELVALSWRVKGFYDNEVTKDKEALVDANATKFPSEAEKNAAISQIYEDISEAYAYRNQYIDEIAFEKAAVSLGATWDEHYICHGYYELKRYDEAVQACTQAIDDTGGGYAWYWRGEAYRQSNRPDQALEDLTRTADSEDGFAPYAAVDMSMIAFGRHDNQGALNILNRYTFLYDASRTEASQVAVAYNNRCYAYMQLGEKKKALDDCTRSLQYGSIPDAFRKQQELVKLLAPPGQSGRLNNGAPPATAVPVP
jgi:tetratricopeptide (TPR) repeat protein